MSAVGFMIRQNDNLDKSNLEYINFKVQPYSEHKDEHIHTGE